MRRSPRAQARAAASALRGRSSSRDFFSKYDSTRSAPPEAPIASGGGRTARDAGGPAKREGLDKELRFRRGVDRRRGVVLAPQVLVAGGPRGQNARHPRH